MRLTLLVCFILAIGTFLSFNSSNKNENIGAPLVLDVLNSLGDSMPSHYVRELDLKKVKQGAELYNSGVTRDDNGKLTKRQSKYFVCTDCHNNQIEDPVLSNPNPEDRLKYALDKELPFLPGTTMYGAVNRTSWYNDDYLKKYGDLVRPANDTLENAIHLCCVECSQGRPLDDWEMDAMVQYYNSIGYTIADIGLSEEEGKRIDDVLSNKKTEEYKELIQLIKSKYSSKSSATFLNPIKKENRKLGEVGNAETGKNIYELSCLKCHAQGRVTNYILDNQKITFNHLNRFLESHYSYSVYEISRKGTYAMPGYKPYMPNYTLERLSHQQLEDLVAYIKSEAK